MTYEDRPYCCYCGKKIVFPLHITKEHLIPISKGGNNSTYNKRYCCNRCNTWRGNRGLDEWEAEIKKILSLHGCQPPFSELDLRIILENIDYIKIYIESAGNKLLK